MIDWKYDRREYKKRYKVYAHYIPDVGDEIYEVAGETTAYSPEQAARNVSYKCGDNGDREIQYNGYRLTYEAVESN